MVFLDQHGVVQTHAMVVAAAAAYRVLLRAAQAGQGLARVEHMDASAGDSLGETVREGRGAAESLQKIECGALAGELAAGGAAQRALNLVGRDEGAVAYLPRDLLALLDERV